MSNTIFMSVSALIYSLIIMIIFFVKKKIMKLENIVYRYLLVATVLSCVSELLIPFFAFESPLGKIVQKTFLVFIIVWFSLFVIYTYIIARYNSNKKQNSSKSYKYLILFIFINVILCSLVYILPIYFYDIPPAKYTYGPSVDIVFGTVGLYMLFLSFVLIMNFKSLKQKKYLPILLTVVLFSVAVFIQKLNPSLLLINSVIGIVTAIMYFTIENPDLKMLNDYYEAKDYAEDLNIEKQMFIYNISQDMKQPLLKMARFCEDLLYSDDIDKYKTGVRGLKGECNSMLQKINDIFDIEATDIRNLETDNTKYNTNNTFEIITGMMEKEVKKSGKKIELVSTISDTLPKELIGDVIRLKEVLNIVFFNSLKYTNEGYIEFKVQGLAKGNIYRLLISIEDSGVGISADKLSTMFERDRIIDKDSKDETKIDPNKKNLALAKRIINVLGGNLVVTSNLNVGTKVSIVLDQGIYNSDNDDDKYKSVFINDNKILLMGADKGERKLLMRSIADNGGVMETVDNMGEVLDNIKKHKRYKMVILDADLPYHDISQMVDKLKQIKSFNTNIVVLSKDKEIKSLKKRAVMGIQGYIGRPLSEQDINDTLNSITAKK